jgi:hypothetical protein
MKRRMFTDKNENVASNTLYKVLLALKLPPRSYGETRKESLASFAKKRQLAVFADSS